MTETVANTHHAYVLVAQELPFYKLITKDGTCVALTSNPDIAIIQSQEADVRITTKNWDGVSDHRPVTFTIKDELKLKEIRRRVAKSLFIAPEAIKETKRNYEWTKSYRR